jgi:hypothetical protein
MNTSYCNQCGHRPNPADYDEEGRYACPACGTGAIRVVDETPPEIKPYADKIADLSASLIDAENVMRRAIRNLDYPNIAAARGNLKAYLELHGNGSKEEADDT